MKDIKKIVWAEFMRIPAEIFFLDPVSGKSTRETRKLSPPVGIVIEAHFKGGQRRDPDNLYVKPIIDGMVAAKVIPDDNGEVVKSVTLMAKRNQEMDLVIIEVIEI